MDKSTKKIKYNTFSPDFLDEVEIGDKDKDYFRPHAKIKKWGEECWIKIWREADNDDKQAIPALVNDKLRWKNSNEEVDFYALGRRSFLEGGVEVEQLERGGFEIELLLKEKPVSNKVVFKMESHGVHFAKQLGELTSEEIESCFRPENVWGSYAIYHKTKTNVHRGEEEANKYKTSKFGQLYRPEIVDANGWKVFGEIDIDKQTIEKKGKVGNLTITIPQDFIDNAVYPINIDPTFGYESAGSESLSITEVRITFNYYSSGAADAGDATKLTAYVGADVANLASKSKIYDSSLNAIANGETNEVANTPTTAAWTDYAFGTSPSIANSTQYNFAIKAETSAADKGFNNVYWYRDYDVDNFDQFENKNDNDATRVYADAWPASLTNDGTDVHYRRHSIYCTTGVAGGPANLKSANGVAIADIKSINGVAIADVKSVNGIA